MNIFGLSKPEEEINKQKWWLLQELKKEWLLVKKGNKIKFVLRDSTDKNVPNLERQEKLLNNLAEWSDSTTEFGNCIDLKADMGFYIVTIIPFNFNVIYGIYESMHTKGEENLSSQEGIKSSYWVRKDENGKYFYRDKLVIIKSPKAKYFIIFDVVYNLAEKGGDIEYDKIKECCKKRKLTTGRKKIQRALTGESALFFKHVKGIDGILSGGISLFEADTNGKFLTFNNKKN